MARLFNLLIVLVLAVTAYASEDGSPTIVNLRNAGLRTKFTGSKLIKINATTQEHVDLLHKLIEIKQFDFWKPPSLEDPAEVMVSHQEEPDLLEFLNRANISYAVVINDIESMVSKEHIGLRQASGKSMSWTAYHYPEDIFYWMNRLKSTRSNVYVNTSEIGYSLEERPIKLVKISSGDSTNKRAVFLDGGIHAREWISSAVSTYIVNELTNKPDKYEALLKKYDFYIIPLLNPDGYAHSVYYNRFWRKSRRNVDSISNFFGCRGVDLNRNFGYNWGGHGAGTQACSMQYAGTEAFSEPETAAIRNFIKQNPEIDWIAYFSLHAFGQKWMTPWGNTREVPADYDEMMRVGQIGADALKSVHGTRYRLGSSSNVMYSASGSSADWFKGALGVPYSYTLELRDYGLFGFLLPAYQILPTAEETWVGIQASLLAIPDK